MKKYLQSLYNIEVDHVGNFRSFEKYKYKNGTYLVVPVSHIDPGELDEISQLGDYFYYKGDQHVATIVKNKRGEIISKADEGMFVLLKCPSNASYRNSSIGAELAKFHHNGRRIPFPVQKLIRIGQWKNLWEKRLDQMEQFWLKKLTDHPGETFERLFIESFPYYVGLTENAIQYLVDTEIDDQPKEIDAGTVCHHRFSSDCWNEKEFMKLPTDWVFDHPSRDLVEWIRADFWSGKNRENRNAYNMLAEYESVSPLSSFSYRLLYSRLLFPVHYFECIERYYRTNDEGVKSESVLELKNILKRSVQYEQLLKNIHATLSQRVRYQNLPKVNWIG
ncbi:spore coat putative kinase YutH [Bacillus salitolerans]|uniref:Spore coat putative kinase YutH n=1 Tax=Bacillus salitolerans TaxID=1437434 RepID=A0ABW4LTD4_9BACI